MADDSEKRSNPPTRSDHVPDATGAHSRIVVADDGDAPQGSEPIAGVEGGAEDDLGTGARSPVGQNTTYGWSPAGGTTGSLGDDLGSGMPGSGRGILGRSAGVDPEDTARNQSQRIDSAIATGGRGRDMEPLGGGTPGEPTRFGGGIGGGLGSQPGGEVGINDPGQGGPAGDTGLTGVPYREAPGVGKTEGQAVEKKFDTLHAAQPADMREDHGESG